MPPLRVQRSAATLEGGCECGRNQYTIYVPSPEGVRSEAPRIQFDGSSWSLSANAQPASVFLRVPLAWLHSTTYAFFPDESPAHIRRSYTPRHAPSSKRFFCGVCSDLLSVWSEESPEDAAYVHVNWHTLELESREALDELGILPEEDDPDGALEGKQEQQKQQLSGASEGPRSGDKSSNERGADAHDVPATQTQSSGPTSVLSPPVIFENLLGRDMPWFESMLDGSPMGRMRRRTGGGVSSDGRTRIEWEIVEYGSDVGQEGSSHSPQLGSKRRLGDDTEPEDVTMR